MQRWKCPNHNGTLKSCVLIKYELQNFENFIFNCSFSAKVTCAFLWKKKQKWSELNTKLEKQHFFHIIDHSWKLKNQNSLFKLESPSRFCMLILNGDQIFKFPGFLYTTLIGWILHTLGYKYKIRGKSWF